MPTATETPALDVSGRPLLKGDTVSSLNGQMTGKIWELRADDDETFACIRPLHQPYAPATWYAADQLIWVATPGSGSSKDKDKAKTPPKTAQTTIKTPENSEKHAKNTLKPKK